VWNYELDECYGSIQALSPNINGFVQLISIKITGKTGTTYPRTTHGSIDEIWKNTKEADRIFLRTLKRHCHRIRRIFPMPVVLLPFS
jgi:phage-related protein